MKLKGRIDPMWAEEVDKESVKIFQYNDYERESIHPPFPLMGGLIIGIGKKVLRPRAAGNLMEAHSTVNLAFGEPGLVTTTEELLLASHEQRGYDDELTNYFKQRSVPSVENRHGGNERWLFPVRAFLINEVAVHTIQTDI